MSGLARWAGDPARVRILALMAVAVIALATQATAQVSDAAAAGSTLRTAWGDPDLQGLWDFRTLTPIERPDALAGSEFLTAEQAAAIEQRALEPRSVWLDYGTRLLKHRRTSLITRPRDGKIPWTPAMRRRMATFTEPYLTGPEDRTLAERCIVGFNSGPPMLPSAYNNNVRLLQTPDHVVILNEMIHSARIVPLRGPPYLAPRFRPWVGDSRGYWDGDTLVIETRNIRETIFLDSSPALRVVERLTRTDEHELLYEFTLDDPAIWTGPWTAALTMLRSEGPMFEYACHEGNSGMTGMLAGTRAEEREPRSR